MKNPRRLSHLRGGITVVTTAFALCALLAIAACSGGNSTEAVATDAGNALDAKIAEDANAPRTGLQYNGGINLVRSAK